MVLTGCGLLLTLFVLASLAFFAGREFGRAGIDICGACGTVAVFSCLVNAILGVLVLIFFDYRAGAALCLHGLLSAVASSAVVSPQTDVVLLVVFGAASIFAFVIFLYFLWQKIGVN